MSMRYYVSSEEASFFLNNKMGISDKAPTTGTYKVGDFIISNTQANGVFGWVCTVAGTPGTWIEIGAGGNSGTTNVTLSSTTTISSPTSEVRIGIDGFNKSTDFLTVYKNSTYLTEGVDYEISSDSSKIVSKNGNWNTESLSDYRFSFIVMKEVSKVNPEAVVGTENLKDNVVTMSKLGEDVKESISVLENKKLNISDSGFIRPEWSEKWDDNDQTEAFKDCIKIITDEFKERGSSSLSIRLRGNYTISSTLKFNSFVKFVTDATTQITFNGEGYLFHIVAEDDVLPNLPQVCTSQGNVLDGSSGSLILKGNLSKNQTAIRLGEDVQGTLFRTSLAQTCISHVYIVNFDRAISFSSIQVFINRFFNVSASHCNTILHDEQNTYNSGELITWTDCSFHNSKVFLDSNGEIYHEFKGCSIDYNDKGLKFDKNRVTVIRFTDCWIEGNARNNDDYFIEMCDITGVINTAIVFKGCQFHFGNVMPKPLNKGKVKIILTDNSVMIDRYNTKFVDARFLFLFTKDAQVLSEKGTFYNYMISLFSPNNAININQFMDAGNVGESTLKGYSLGGAGVTVTDEKSYFSDKCVKVNTSSSSYCDFVTEAIDLKGSDYVYGNSIHYLSGSDKNLNLQYTIFFYKDDKTTEIGQVTFHDTANYNNYDDGWFSGMWGTGETITKVPNGATHAKLKVTYGNISNKTLYIGGIFLYPYK